MRRLLLAAALVAAVVVCGGCPGGGKARRLSAEVAALSADQRFELCAGMCARGWLVSMPWATHMFGVGSGGTHKLSLWLEDMEVVLAAIRAGKPVPPPAGAVAEQMAVDKALATPPEAYR